MELHEEITIDAPASVVWDVLADTDRYPRWNPFIPQLTGELRVGSRIRVTLSRPDRRPVTMRPRLLVVEPERELRWLGRIVVPGLFDGEHRFQLEPLADDRTRFVQSEHFTGALLPVLRRALGTTQAGFALMNEALKAQAEAEFAGLRETLA
jgi:hypothetical protein